MIEAERRFTAVRVEARAAVEGKHTIGGYAAKFNRFSQNLGGFRERLLPGVFNRQQSQGWPGFDGSGVLARYNHDDDALLGTTGSGSLRLNIDGEGLVYEVDLLDDALSERVFKLVQRGDVAKSSFAFIADDDDWDVDESGFPIRSVIQARLGDVAPVNSPAYLDTSTGLRSLARKFDAPFEEVKQLADSGELIKFFRRSDVPAAPVESDPVAERAEVSEVVEPQTKRGVELQALVAAIKPLA
jgi:HK97 family phage prohead protease